MDAPGPPPLRRLRRPHALVTGAAGFVGSHLVEALCASGYDVTGVDALLERPYSAASKRSTLSALAQLPAFRFRTVDLRSARLEDLVGGVDVIVHAAALAGLVHTTADPSAAWQHNAAVTARLVTAAGGAGVGRFVHVSTSSVYGRYAVGDENQAQRPISVYGHSKRAAEQAVLAAARRGDLDALVVRYFSVYGPRQRADMAYHRFIEAILDDQPLTVHGDGAQRRSITYVGDAVSATLAAVQRGRCGDAYNIGGDHSLTLLEAIEMIGSHLGVQPRLRYVAGPHGDQQITRADTAKARDELDWVATIGAGNGIANQVAWHRSRRAAPLAVPLEVPAHS